MAKKPEKSENRKALPKFLLLILGSMLAGGFIGFLTAVSEAMELVEALVQWLTRLLDAAVVWGIPATALVTLGGALILYSLAKRRFEGWDGEDEETIDQAEELLSWALLLTGLQVVLSMFCFAVVGQHLSEQEPVLLATAEFLLSFALLIFAQQKIVDMEKRINPEKHGSVYDVKFHKKWIESCDEAERQQIGQAALRAYRVTSGACLSIWLVLMILGILYDIGVLPAFVVLLVWGILQVSYILECIRISRKSRGKLRIDNG